MNHGGDYDRCAQQIVLGVIGVGTSRASEDAESSIPRLPASSKEPREASLILRRGDALGTTRRSQAPGVAAFLRGHRRPELHVGNVLAGNDLSPPGSRAMATPSTRCSARCRWSTRVDASYAAVGHG
jgi:hypothetical protein